jgi:hypothetical protein
VGQYVRLAEIFGGGWAALSKEAKQPRDLIDRSLLGGQTMLPVGTIIKKNTRNRRGRYSRSYLYIVKKVQKFESSILVEALGTEVYWGLRVDKNGIIDARGNGGLGILKVICTAKELARDNGLQHGSFKRFEVIDRSL